MAAKKSTSVPETSAINVKWDDTILLFIEGHIHDRQDFDDERRKHALSALINLLGDSLHLAAKNAKVRDNWQSQMVSLVPFGAVVHMRSERTNTSFNLGFDMRGFFFEAAPDYLKNLRHMDDDFWFSLASMTQRENFDLVIHEQAGGDLADKAKRLLPNKKSRLFSLLREYMIQSLTDSRFGIGSFASLAYYWPFDIYPENFQEELAGAFKDIWTIDYQLWKVSYQQENKQKNMDARAQ